MSVVDGLPFADEKKKYICEVLDPILEEMVSDTLTDMPKDPTGYMINWLRKRSGMPVNQKRMSAIAQNEQLKNDIQNAAQFVEDAISGVPQQDEQEEEEEESDDECDEIPDSFKKSEESMGRARQSVSAEAYGQWNQKKAFTPPVHAKSPEQKARLQATLQKSFMFAVLEPKDMEIIVDAMVEVPIEPGTRVIVEGEDGDYLFVIEEGVLECMKNINGEEKVVKVVNAGDVFGELALLYNCPRAASVEAKERCVCWKLDRETFNHIVKEASTNRRNRYDGFLKSVNILGSLDAYERSQIADALKCETYDKGAVIVKQDEPGDKFYIVEEGSLYALKTTSEGEKKVMSYTVGDYFGELALLKNQPRAASIIVESDSVKVLSLDRRCFKKMLGSLQDIMTKQTSKYN
eukprot:gnl/TRDRNA2_/TRDRNA2_134446_c0_seq2.p1 gnl/TRDRNA2_/TRDRNA2_134446_c0~~gnl/TRDRNA2_/TRDRNA2_134446_c0_seq2.p1  ORF type:complete len:405 (+),score=118.75 gnl/TRDRNA2_/TRDRNA2_134446_c0_seq2:114-1328(+)